MQPRSSDPRTSSHIATRPRRRTWLLALPVVAVAGLASISAAYAFPGGPAAGASRGGAPHGGAMEGFVAHRLERILDRVNATQGQRDQIHAVWNGLRPQLRALRTQHGELRRQIVAAVTAPTINATDIEKLRQQSMSVADKTSALFTQGIVASAQVLTPEQRKLAQEEMAKARGFHHHFGGGEGP